MHQLKFAQWYFKIAKISSKFWQILNEHFQNCQSVLTLCQSGKILPNTVTLEGGQEQWQLHTTNNVGQSGSIPPTYGY